MKGIYKIECLVNGKIYIGSTTVSFKKRFQKHRQRLRYNYHENDYLQKSWNKYGENNFSFSILENINNDNKIKLREKYWLKKYFSKGSDFCFNLSDHVDGGNTLKTDKIRKKHSKNIKKSYTPELLEKRSKDSIRRKDEISKTLEKTKKTKKWKDNHRKGNIKKAKNKVWIKKMKLLGIIRGRKVKTNLGEVFNSIKEASRKTGATRSGIRKSIKGIYETCMGRKWKYC